MVNTALVPASVFRTVIVPIGSPGVLVLIKNDWSAEVVFVR